MAGTPANARLWEDANVYVAFDPDDAPTPADADTVFDDTKWTLVGLLDGGQGFSEDVSEDETDQFAWGQRLMRTTRANFKLTKTFTAYEYNDAVRRLLWPGSTLSDTGGTLKIPRPERIKVAFETFDNDVTRRLISAYQAEVVRDGAQTEAEENVTSYGFIATIFPGGVNSDELFIEQLSGYTS